MSPFMKMKITNMADRDYTTLFSISNMRKDLKLLLSEVSEKGKSIEFLEIVESLYKKGLDLGFKDEDISAVIKAI